MLLENVATIRTGVVNTRKKDGEKDPIIYEYKLLNLKCAATAGYLDLQYSETLGTTEPLKPEYFTQMDDILVRLSAPYTAIMITDLDCNLQCRMHKCIKPKRVVFRSSTSIVLLKVQLHPEEVD